jgi:AcrR family transcriptional regulator
MSRVRADDYDAKQQSILESAAALFAAAGYPSVKMQHIAEACGATKSMLYHYFPTKDHILQALLSEHLERLIADVQRAIEAHATAKQRFAAFVRVHVQKSAQSSASCDGNERSEISSGAYAKAHFEARVSAYGTDRGTIARAESWIAG